MDRNFIEPAAVDHQRAAHSNFSQRFSDRTEQRTIRHPEQLDRRVGRIAAWAEQIHDRPDAQHFAYRPGMCEPGMITRREQEAESAVVESGARLLRSAVQLSAKRLQHIGRAALGRDRAVAVLDD